MRGRLYLVGVLVTGAAMVGCGDGEHAKESGMTHFEHDGLSVQYPAAWERDDAAEKKGADDGMLLLAVGSSGVGGAPYRLSLFDQPSEYSTIGDAGKDVADVRGTDLQGDVSDGPFEVPGAPPAWRIVTDYKLLTEGEGSPTVPARAIDVIWLDGDRQINLTFSGPRDKMDTPAARAVIKSLRAG
jgi:hypothetical protein